MKKITLELNEKEIELLEAMIEKGLRQMINHKSCTLEQAKEMFNIESKVYKAMWETEEQ